LLLFSHPSADSKNSLSRTSKIRFDWGASAVARRIADFGDAGVRVCSKPKSMLLAKCAVVGGLQDATGI
jgi:hypothetical protein